MAPLGLGESLLSAVQASVSVLLLMLYGGIAAWFGLLNTSNTKAISKVCVRMFLPALLITKIGSELHAGSASRYLIVLVWALVSHAVSFLIGLAAHQLFGMPDWTIAAVMFNNTTSYPLLLIGALDETGILGVLTRGDESTSDAVERAKSYFLVFSTVSSCLTFAVGPRLVDSEYAPESDEKEDDEEEEQDPNEQHGDAARTNGHTESRTDDDDDDGREVDEETGLLAARPAAQFRGVSGQNGFSPSTKKKRGSHGHSSSSPSNPADPKRPRIVTNKLWNNLGPRARWWLVLASDFLNAPLLGALAGATVGLTPPLHRAFFNDTREGGVFNAWLTASLRQLGGLFVPLPVVVAGVSLLSSFPFARGRGKPRAQRDRERQQERGDGDSEEGERTRQRPRPCLPWTTTLFVLLVRFVLWPVVSLSVVWALASRTGILGGSPRRDGDGDPMLWFAMMLMPAGPPATKLMAMVQTSDADLGEQETIARLLSISYLVSPALSFTVVAALRATQSAL